jgi:hypothetical protein
MERTLVTTCVTGDRLRTLWPYNGNRVKVTNLWQSTATGSQSHCTLCSRDEWDFLWSATYLCTVNSLWPSSSCTFVPCSLLCPQPSAFYSQVSLSLNVFVFVILFAPLRGNMWQLLSLSFLLTRHSPVLWGLLEMRWILYTRTTSRFRSINALYTIFSAFNLKNRISFLYTRKNLLRNKSGRQSCSQQPHPQNPTINLTQNANDLHKEKHKTLQKPFDA